MNPTPEAVQLIRKMLKAGIGHTKIAATAGVSTYIIIRIDEQGVRTELRLPAWERIQKTFAPGLKLSSLTTEEPENAVA